ncbi:Maf1 regulator-domain-containing protein [Pyronema omphalodes]|nr:Maf1 regulator-domain-containing protein [Pyronema omphalodes]
MKFLPLRKLDPINRALVFDTPDSRIVGGCEIYTTKAAGADKKLYKSISNTLSSRYESDLRLSESLSPPHSSSLQSQAVYKTLHSPFGPLDQISARKTFAYMIATLNASHPDYDFSSVLRPSDFRREKNLRQVINTFNTTLFNLGVKSLPRMWDIIDEEMDLAACGVYSYQPQDVADDPYGEEGLLWSNVYFFFSKERKRVCYLYLRGISALGHSPSEQPGVWSLNGVRNTIDEEMEVDEEEEWDDNKSIWGDDGDAGYDDIEGMDV